MPLRFRDIKRACAKAAELCETDERLFDVVNECCETLLYKGKWKGTVLTFNFCVNSQSCIVWPREIETVEAIALCKTPITVRSEWFEFSQNGIGLLDGADNCVDQLIDRGEVPAFEEVIGTNKKLAVYTDRDEGTGKYITLQFYDKNGQWVRSSFNGEEIDGEKLLIPSTAGNYVYTTNICKAGGFKRVAKDETLGVIRLYSYDTTSGALNPLAYYQPGETLPSYRSSLLPMLNNASCGQQQVRVKAKSRFIPVRTDDDWVMIDNLRALRLGVKSIKKEYDEDFQSATIYMGMARAALDEQLHHHKGFSEQITINMAPASVWGGGSRNLQ